jgi:hypothetical protein
LSLRDKVKAKQAVDAVLEFCDGVGFASHVALLF